MEENNTEKSIFKRTVAIIGNILIFTIIIAILIIIVRALVLKKLDVFGYRFYMIMSGSMEPTISLNDIVITKELDEKPKKGDIIAFQDTTIVTIHRIVEIYSENGEELYETKGDNNNTVDSDKVKLTEIKGKVVYTIKDAGKVVSFIKSYFIIFVYIIAILIIIIIVRRLI